MKKTNDQLINSIFNKLKKYEHKGIKIKRKDVEDFYYMLIKSN